MEQSGNSMKTRIFTAAEIATALNVTAQSVRQMLAGTEPSGNIIVRGQETKAWAVECLPGAIIARLESTRQAKLFRSIVEVLTMKWTRYFPAFPLAEIAQADIDQATRLRNALARVLKHPEWKGVELESAGCEDFRKEHGREISTSRWSEIYRRTVDRDGGLREWHRIELYLPDQPRRISIATEANELAGVRFAALELAIGSVKKPSSPTLDEKALIWFRAFEQFKLLKETLIEEKKAKKAIIQILFNSGYVGRDERNIERNFLRKINEYNEASDHPSAIEDKRGAANKKRRLSLPEKDRLMLLASTVDCEGRMSQGFREAIEDGKLSMETAGRYITNPASKSYVPKSLRNLIALDAEKAVKARRRPLHTELNGAYIPRNPDGLYANDSHCADDCTLPVWFWVPDPDAKHGVRVTRGQFIPMMDERSWRVLTFALDDEKSYNSRDIRNLITITHDDWGLPRRRFRFEHGIWKNSKILKGDVLATEHAELGLKEFGVTFSHANWAHGKMAESVLAIVQNQLERCPGYSSRNEITEKNEILAAQLREIAAGKVHPSKYLWSKDEWVVKLEELMALYNSIEQQGKWLNRISPDEAWERYQHPTEKCVHLGLQARYLLAHHRVPMKVGDKGILLRKSLGGGLYADENTGRLVDRRVLVWVNPDQLDYIAITDLDRTEKPMFIKQVGPVPAIDSTTMEYKAAKAQVDAHNKVPRTIYRSIKPLLASHNFRALQVDRKTIEMGQHIAAGEETAKQQRKQGSLTARKVTVLSNELRMAAPKITPKTAERTALGLEYLKRANQIHYTGVDDEPASPAVPKAANGAKQYTVTLAPAQTLSTGQRHAIFNRLWAAVEAAKPKTNKWAIMKRAVGKTSIKEMTDEEFQKLSTVLKAIARSQ